MRISLEEKDGRKFLGSVKFHGAIGPKTYYGVEWDDPSRGRHDGVDLRTGIRYFATDDGRNSGSLVSVDRKGLHLGKALSDVLHDRGETVETVRRKRALGLAWTDVCCLGTGPLLDFASLTFLDLSYCLVERWLDINAMVSAMPKLDTVILTGNRFEANGMAAADESLSALDRVRELHLNATRVTLEAVRVLLGRTLKSLQTLQLAYNELQDAGLDTPFEQQTSIENLNISYNPGLRSWRKAMSFVSPFSRLRHLNFDGCGLLFEPTENENETICGLSIREISKITYDDLLNIDHTLPQLTSLNITLQEQEISSDGILAIFSKLRTLNQSEVTVAERRDAEMAIAQRGFAFGEENKELVSKRDFLRKKYDITAAEPPKRDVIKNKLVNINVEIDGTIYPMAFLPSTKIKLVKQKIMRQILKDRQRHIDSVKISYQKGNTLELTAADQDRDLAWWTVFDGDSIILS